MRGAGSGLEAGSRARLDVLLAVVGAHCDECGADDHREEDKSENKIVEHGGPSCGRRSRLFTSSRMREGLELDHTTRGWTGYVFGRRE